MAEENLNRSDASSTGDAAAAPTPIVLEYRRPVPPRRRATFLRWTMFTLAILAIAAAAILLLNPVLEISESLGGGVLGTPFGPVRRSFTEGNASLQEQAIRTYYLPEALAYLGMFLLMQWWFLLPRGTWRINASNDVPMSRRSAIAAAFIGMLLSIGLLATLMEIPDLWIDLTTEKGINSEQHFKAIWLVMAIVWIGWTIIFLSYARSLDRYTALRKMFRGLLAGTVLELVISAPAHLLITRHRRDDCYCERGTWTGVAFGCTAALWLFGPGTFLLFMREKRRRNELI